MSRADQAAGERGALRDAARIGRGVRRNVARAPALFRGPARILRIFRRWRIKLSGFGSRSYVRFFWFFSSVGGVGKPEACPCRPQARRRADLSGVFGISDRSVLIVAADASGSVKDGVGAVGVNVDLDPRLDEMRPHRALRDLQLERPVGDAIVMADLPLLLRAQDLVELDAGNGVKPEPSPAGGTAKRALWAGR
jgi:hypothetical protein